MKIKHTLANNRIEITLTLTPMASSHFREISYDAEQVRDLCRAIPLPIGQLVSRNLV